jgi:amino acid transporter
VYEAIPHRFSRVHPRYMTPAFGTVVMGVAALGFYLLLTFISENALADSVASLGLAVAFYYGITAYSCTWYFRRTLFESTRNLFMRGIFPLLGALAMTWAFIQSAVDRSNPTTAIPRSARSAVCSSSVWACCCWGFHSCCCASRSAPNDSSAAKPSRPKRKSRYSTLTRSPNVQPLRNFAGVICRSGHTFGAS